MDEEEQVVPHVLGASIKMGPFTVTASSLKSSVVALGVAAMDEFEVLNQSDRNCVLRATAVVYPSTLNGIMAIKAERNCYNQEFESLPPYRPLELVKLSTAGFVRLVSKHKKCILHALDADSAIPRRNCKRYLSDLCDQ